MVLGRDIYGAWTGYMRCANHLYPVQEPHIDGVNTIYMRWKHAIYDKGITQAKSLHNYPNDNR